MFPDCYYHSSASRCNRGVQTQPCFDPVAAYCSVELEISIGLGVVDLDMVVTIDTITRLRTVGRPLWVVAALGRFLRDWIDVVWWIVIGKLSSKVEQQPSTTVYLQSPKYSQYIAVTLQTRDSGTFINLPMTEQLHHSSISTNACSRGTQIDPCGVDTHAMNVQG